MHEEWEKSVAAKAVAAPAPVAPVRGRLPRCHRCGAPRLTYEQIMHLRSTLSHEEMYWMRWCICDYAVRPQQKEPPLTVYFIGNLEHGYVKVGQSTDVDSRIKGIQNGCPFPIKLLAALHAPSRVEGAIHRYLSKSRTVGEWFRVTAEVKGLLLLASSGRLQEMLNEWLPQVKPNVRLDIGKLVEKKGLRTARKPRRVQASMVR